MPGITFGFIAGSLSMGILVYLSISCFSNWEEISVQIRKHHLVDGAAQNEVIDSEDLKESLLKTNQ